MTKRHMMVRVALFFLVLANLGMDVAVLWLMEDRFPGAVWYALLPFGLLEGQVLLLGLWLGLGDGRWYVRAAIALFLTLCVARTIRIAFSFVRDDLRVNEEHVPWAAFAFVFIAMMLTASCFAFVLRRAFNWRLTWRNMEVAPATRQFQISDAIVWMTVISGALASMRILVSLHIDVDFLEIAMSAAGTTAIVFGALVVSFAKRPRLCSAVVLALTGLIIGVAFAVPGAYHDMQIVRGNATLPAPFHELVEVWANHTFRNELFVVSATLVTLVNCVILRVLGCKLARPGNFSPLAS